MPIRTVNATVQTYDAHEINDGVNYLAYIDTDNSSAPDGRPIYADVDFDWAYFVGSEKTSRTFSLHIFILKQGDYEERKNELKQWFNTQSGDIQYLVATFTENIPERRIGCRPIAVDFVAGLRCVVTLEANEPFWESNDVETTTWTISLDGDTQEVENYGNINTWPVFKITGTSIPNNTWRYQRPVSIKNNVKAALYNYPIEITGGGWDTAALVTNTAKATAVDDAGNIGAGDTTITVDDTTGFYTFGLIMIDNEQIYYSGKTATEFTGCVRGRGGTTAAAHLDNADVYQSEMFADGRDVRVELDGAEQPRWFGAAAGAATGINDDGTLIWVVISNLPGQNADLSGGSLATLGTDLARSQSVTASGYTAGHSGGKVVDGRAETYWQNDIGDTSGNLVIDLGESKKVNRVQVYHPNSDDAPKDFTIQTSANNVDWATQVTVTNNTVQNGYTVHDFSVVECQYIKVDVTAVQTGGDELRINQVEVYHVNHRLRIKYGNANSGGYALSNARKPLFELDSSTNASWDFNDFFDVANPSRSAAWQSIDVQGLGRQRAYQTTQDGTYANLATVMGVAQKSTSTTVFRDGYQLRNPCGITTVVHSGYTKQNPNYRRWRLLSVPETGDQASEYENTDSTLSVWTAYGPITTTLTQTAIAIIFYHWIKVASDTAMYAEATDVTVTLDDYPTVTLLAATYLPNSQLLSCQILNQQTQESIYLDGMIEADEAVVVDCNTFQCYREDTDENVIAMLSLGEGVVRERWMELEPGTNTLEYIDDSVNGMTIEIEHRSRWI